MVRCKMRCLTITQKIEGWSVELKPVMPKSKDWPGGSEENLRFWQASPSGEVKLSYSAWSSPSFSVGSYYYVDMEQDLDTDRPWKLWEISQMDGALGLRMGLEWSESSTPKAGDLHLIIHNTEAWPLFNQVNSKWHLSFNQADGPAPGLHTYP